MPIRVLVVGLGNMGRAHALAYHRHPGFEIVGLVNRSGRELPVELAAYPQFDAFEAALERTKPDLVSINTYTDTHAPYALLAMERGAHVFVEKPLALTVADAERVAAVARDRRRKLVVGYILRHHPSWVRFIAEARRQPGPHVFRMNLNQQSSGVNWQTHRKLMETTSPLVDCGVHYVDVMCQVTDASAVEVRGMGLRLAGDVASDMYNYGHFQVLFADGSLAWFEAGWGPMISEEAYFIKDIVSPAGSVSIVSAPGGSSQDIESHARSDRIRVHRAALADGGGFATPDEIIEMPAQPGFEALCAREQDFVRRAIAEDLDLDRHVADAVASLRICLAADESVRTGRPVRLA